MFSKSDTGFPSITLVIPAAPLEVHQKAALGSSAAVNGEKLDIPHLELRPSPTNLSVEDILVSLRTDGAFNSPSPLSDVKTLSVESAHAATS